MFNLPRDSRLFVLLKPELQWGWQEVFNNKMVYLLETLVWLHTKDSQKKLPQNKPQPFVPEFMQIVQKKDMVVHTTEDIKNILAMPRE